MITLYYKIKLRRKVFMKNLKACYYELEGTHYEVGKLLGEK